MGRLFPGGRRSAAGSRVFGFESIRAHIREARKGKDHAAGGRTSIADKPHKHEREIARRKRQREKLRSKYMMNGGFSRRGNEVGPL